MFWLYSLKCLSLKLRDSVSRTALSLCPDKKYYSQKQQPRHWFLTAWNCNCRNVPQTSAAAGLPVLHPTTFQVCRATKLSPVSGPGPGCGKGRGWSAYAAPLKWLCFFVFQTYICIYSPVLDVLIRKPVFNVPSCIYLLRGCKAIQ